MSASEAKRDLMYFTFHDPDLANELKSIYNNIKDKTVAQLYDMLEGYEQEEHTILDYFTA